MGLKSNVLLGPEREGCVMTNTCGTCKDWEFKGTSCRGEKDGRKCGPCHNQGILPDSFIPYQGKEWMFEDEGKTCPCWQPRSARYSITLDGDGK